MLGFPNSDLQYVAASRDNAFDWVWRNIMIFEVYGLKDRVKVSTSVDTIMIGVSFPPSQGAFRDNVRAYINPIIGFLVAINAPLLVNVYPYFSHAGNPVDISLAYATFTSPGTVVQDGANGYQNLFDAMVDVMYTALEKAGGTSLEIVISGTGWPSTSAFAATFENARTYYTNMVAHAPWGTPKRPRRAIETYLFSMFDEKNKEPQLGEKLWSVLSKSTSEI